MKLTFNRGLQKNEMNYYLTEINDQFTNLYYSLQTMDQRIFLCQIKDLNFQYVPAGTESFPSAILPEAPHGINAIILPFYNGENSKHWKKIRNVQKFRREVLYTKMSEEEKLLTNKIEINLAGNGLNIVLQYYIDGGRIQHYLSTALQSSQESYISSEPNWKVLKSYYLRYLQKLIDYKNKSNSFMLYWNLYYKLVNECFYNYTPINKKFKVNLNYLKNLQYNKKNKTTKNFLKAFINWKKFLSEINAEKIKDENIEYSNFLLDKQNPPKKIIKEILNKNNYSIITTYESEFQYPSSIPMMSDILIFKKCKLHSFISCNGHKSKNSLFSEENSLNKIIIAEIIGIKNEK